MGKTLQDFVHRQDELHWERSQQGDADIFQCSGAFSLVSHGVMEKMAREVLSGAPRRIVLDMREVAHMDSAGLGILAMIIKHTISTPRFLVVIPSPQVSNLIASTGLDRVVARADSLPAALEVQPK